MVGEVYDPAKAAAPSRMKRKPLPRLPPRTAAFGWRPPSVIYPKKSPWWCSSRFPDSRSTRCSLLPAGAGRLSPRR